jgi:hypothetical protein
MSASTLKKAAQARVAELPAELLLEISSVQRELDQHALRNPPPSRRSCSGSSPIARSVTRNSAGACRAGARPPTLPSMRSARAGEPVGHPISPGRAALARRPAGDRSESRRGSLVLDREFHSTSRGSIGVPSEFDAAPFKLADLMPRQEIGTVPQQTAQLGKRHLPWNIAEFDGNRRFRGSQPRYASMPPMKASRKWPG